MRNSTVEFSITISARYEEILTTISLYFQCKKLYRFELDAIFSLFLHNLVTSVVICNDN